MLSSTVNFPIAFLCLGLSLSGLLNCMGANMTARSCGLLHHNPRLCHMLDKIQVSDMSD